jgi:hypothetical protein
VHDEVVVVDPGQQEADAIASSESARTWSITGICVTVMSTWGCSLR